MTNHHTVRKLTKSGMTTTMAISHELDPQTLQHAIQAEDWMIIQTVGCLGPDTNEKATSHWSRMIMATIGLVASAGLVGSIDHESPKLPVASVAVTNTDHYHHVESLPTLVVPSKPKLPPPTAIAEKIVTTTTTEPPAPTTTTTQVAPTTAAPPAAPAVAQAPPVPAIASHSLSANKPASCPSETPTTLPPPPPVTGGTIGSDVSYPNCCMSVPNENAVAMVGVNGGNSSDFNPCFAYEVSEYNNPMVYVNTDYPGDALAAVNQNSAIACPPTISDCVAYRYGYQNGVSAVDFVHSQGVNLTALWLDVETSNQWTGTTLQHQDALVGEVDGTEASHMQIYGDGIYDGYYANVRQWDIITGGMVTDLPAWIPGAENQSQAEAFCRNPSFSNSKTLFVQFVGNYLGNAIDYDYDCTKL